uniref:Uncharacterized protein n=1 Tax=Anguilla anguilla TaxID=7936 RepID=A0A0E9V1Q8_ANGAN
MKEVKQLVANLRGSRCRPGKRRRGAENAEDPTRLSLHPRLQHYPSGVLSDGVCGHSWSGEPVPQPAAGHRHHPPPPLWKPHVLRQQPVQHDHELA